MGKGSSWSTLRVHVVTEVMVVVVEEAAAGEEAAAVVVEEVSVQLLCIYVIFISHE